LKKNIFFHLFRYRGGNSIIFYIALIALLWYLFIPHTSFYFKTDLFTPFWKRLNEQDITLVEGETFKLYVMGINKRVSFSSTDIKVADVNIFGKVTTFRCGTTIIKAKVNHKVIKCRVRVIKISKKNLTLKIGKSSRLKIKGAWFGVRWTSSNTSVVVVSKSGKVTAVSKGSVIISGKVRGKTVSCNIKVE